MGTLLKEDTKVVRKKGLNYVVGTDGKPLRFKPWIGDSLSFVYDSIMKRSIFPKKFGSDMTAHHDVLRQELKAIREKRVLELAAGGGSAVNFLANDNRYTGIDVSPGLLRRASNRILSAGFEDAELYYSKRGRSALRSKIIRCVYLRLVDELAKIFCQNGFGFETIPGNNGALLYFTGIKE